MQEIPTELLSIRIIGRTQQGSSGELQSILVQLGVQVLMARHHADVALVTLFLLVVQNDTKPPLAKAALTGLQDLRVLQHAAAHSQKGLRIVATAVEVESIRLTWHRVQADADRRRPARIAYVANLLEVDSRQGHTTTY